MDKENIIFHGKSKKNKMLVELKKPNNQRRVPQVNLVISIFRKKKRKDLLKKDNMM